MMSIKEAKQALMNIHSRDRFKVMLEVTAIFTELMEQHGIKPVIVGGLAVEIYTRSQYTTQDIDLIFARRDLADKTLVELGFLKEGRHWYHPDLEVSIEIPNDILEDADPEKIIKLRLPEGKYVYVIGIEDIILDRLRACVHWKSTSDCEWGFRMFTVHFDHLNLDYMKAEVQKSHPKEYEMLTKWLQNIENQP
jgi:hypothetical protein